MRAVQTVGGDFVRFWVLAVAAWSVAAFFDAGLVAVGSGQLAMAGVDALYGLALNSWIATLFAGLMALVSVGPLAWLGRRHADDGLNDNEVTLPAGAFLGLLAGLGATVLARPWDLDIDHYQLRLLIPLLGVATGLVAAWLGRRPRIAWPLYILAAAGLIATDLLVLPHLFLRLHVILVYAAAVSLVLATQLLTRDLGELGRRRLYCAALASSVLGHLVLFTSLHDLRSQAERHGSWQSKFGGAVDTIFDFDSDGSSAVFGSDCNEFNAAVSRVACELPDNGIDDNCNGLVDEQWRDVEASMIEQAARIQGEREGGGQDQLQRSVRLPTSARPDIYFILVDALRADWAGGPKPEVFKRLESQSLSFSQAHTPYPSTYRALLSAMQSRAWKHTNEEAPTFATILAKRGYDAQLWIDSRRIHLGGVDDPVRSPVDRSRDPFRVSRDGKTEWTAQLFSEAAAELDQPGLPRFRWLHVLDPHNPLLRGAPKASPLTRYLAEVAHVDEQLGIFLDRLDESARGREAIVVVLGDHGDEFGERGGSMHGGTLYEEMTHVPFVLRMPGVPARRIETPASLIDMVPTLATFLGLERHETWEGHDWLSGGVSVPRVLSEVEAIDNLGGLGAPTKRAARLGVYKLIETVESGTFEFFDLSSDPGETNPLGDVVPQVQRALFDALAVWEDAPSCRRALGQGH